MNYRLPKCHRLCSHIAVDKLFDRTAGSRISVAGPLRAVWQYLPERTSGAQAQFLITIPKKRLRHAVERVTMRRRVREAYRLNHHDFEVTKPVNIAFIYLASDLRPYSEVEKAMRNLLSRIHSLAQ